MVEFVQIVADPQMVDNCHHCHFPKTAFQQEKHGLVVLDDK